MGSCTFLLSKNTPLRTTLIDETTGHAKYQTESPRRFARRFTRIRRFELPPQPPLVLGDKADSDFGDDPTDKGKKKGRFKRGKAELPKTDDEIGRIHWGVLSPAKIDFKGKVSSREEFLPKCGKPRK